MPRLLPTIIGTLLAVAVSLVLSTGPARSPGQDVLAAPPAPLRPAPDVPIVVTAEDRAVAFGILLDSPRPMDVIDEGLEIAEKLRRRYGIDSGDRVADRREAAVRANRELLDRITFSQEEIEASAQSLGYSLDPAQCGGSCSSVRRLAVLELKKEALRAFAEGRKGP